MSAIRIAASCTVFAAGRRHVHQHTPAGIRVNKVRNHTRIIVGGADVRQEERILLLSCHDDEVRSAWARKIRKTETGKLSTTRQMQVGLVTPQTLSGHARGCRLQSPLTAPGYKNSTQGSGTNRGETNSMGRRRRKRRGARPVRGNPATNTSAIFF